MRLAAILACLCLAGCAMPQWRVFQSRVPQETGRTEAQAEGEKRAAAYIVERSRPPVADPVNAVADIHTVAAPLSASLGPPSKAITVEDRAEVIAGLQAALAAKEAELEKWRAFARRHGGRTIEGTGFNLLPFVGTGGLIAVIALCILFPTVGYLLLRVLPLLWRMVRSMIQGVETIVAKAPAAGRVVQAEFRHVMDKDEKAVIKILKAGVKPQLDHELPAL